MATPCEKLAPARSVRDEIRIYFVVFGKIIIRSHLGGVTSSSTGDLVGIERVKLEPPISRPKTTWYVCNECANTGLRPEMSTVDKYTYIQ